MKLFRIVLVLSLILVFAACKKSDDSTTTSSTVTDSSMVTAMPSNLSVSSNTESGSSVSSRGLKGARLLQKLMTTTIPKNIRTRLPD